MTRFFNCPCGKNEENKPLLLPDDSSLQGKKDKGKHHKLEYICHKPTKKHNKIQ